MIPNRIIEMKNLPGGQLGTDLTIAFMTAFAHHFAGSPIVQQYAEALSPAGRSDEDILRELHRFLATHVRFKADPEDAEEVMSPERMLEAIRRDGYVERDCDCRATLAVSLLLAMDGNILGEPCFIVIKERPELPWHHVFYGLRIGEDVWPFDPQTNTPPFEWPAHADALAYPAGFARYAM
jgi:hypothetical protein